jgi:hypothetical protein
VTAGSSGVHVRFDGEDLTSDPPKFIGGFRATADAGKTIDVSTHYRWKTSCGAGKVAQLEPVPPMPVGGSAD